MLDFIEAKRNKRDFLALTGSTLKEFKLILPCFRKAHKKRYEGAKTLAGEKRQCKIGGGHSSFLDGIEQKILFILVCQKTYPVQIVVAKLFELSQPRANQWIHKLLPVLKDTLDELGVMPERVGTKSAADEHKPGVAAAYVIDGTKKRQNRPKSPEKQALHYSGKKKQHTDKNILVTDAKSGRVGYLSSTRPGTIHDKKFAEHEQITYPRNSILHKDTGFQGYEPPVKQTLQPKKPKGKELTRADMRNKRKLPTMRITVEHALTGVKRCRCVKDTLRNTRENCSDDFMANSTGMHNLRVVQRTRPLRR